MASGVNCRPEEARGCGIRPVAGRLSANDDRGGSWPPVVSDYSRASCKHVPQFYCLCSPIDVIPWYI